MKKYILVFLCISGLVLFSMCTQSGRRETNYSNIEGRNRETRKSINELKTSSVVKMENSSGVYYIPSKINGFDMRFIFDTGASDITISLTEALFLLKQGTLTEDDILGTQKYQIADGSISEGTIINLKEIQIGDRVLKNIKATVIHNNEAPLLLGQSALTRFGRVIIDYNRGEILFE